MGIRPAAGDALLLVDVQSDFVSGSLAVPGATAILPVLNGCIAAFRREGLPVLATRDWHPPDHCSFAGHGGQWPAHCVAGTPGAAFAPGLEIDARTLVVSKGTEARREAYSGFERTELDRMLRERGIQRLVVGGLATEYCVQATVVDALRLGYAVVLLTEGIRAVNVKREDGPNALRRMAHMGAVLAGSGDLRLAEAADG
jgi:nicotinamidase/pyrazinamidase